MGSAEHDEDAEPIFRLRARDKYFVPLVRLWIELVEADSPLPIPAERGDAMMEVAEIANAALAW